MRTKRVAAIAEAADIGWYGGTMLETTLGSAALAQVFSTLPAGGYGCELLGPYLLVEDIVRDRMAIRDFELQILDGPGYGVEIDRASAGLEKTTVDFGKVEY